jgi:hypothetical protein
MRNQIDWHAHHRHPLAAIGGSIFGDGLLDGLILIMGDVACAFRLF